MKAGEFAELDQPRHDHLNVDVGRVMSQIDQAESFGPEFARAVIAGPPIVNYRRIKRRLVELVLDKDATVVRQRRINTSHAFHIALQRASKMLLARKVATVTN